MSGKSKDTGKARDAETGHYTTKEDARRRPDKTVIEHDRPKPKKK